MNTYKPHFMVVPSLSCPAECSYCFGPRQGAVMSSRQMIETVEFIAAISKQSNQSRIKVTFHGGEPLMAGHSVMRTALTGLFSYFGEKNLKIAIQSNLWLLDDEYCEMFKNHNVEMGTSLDGPEEITDSQRGRGYFSRTMKGISRARLNGLDVSCITTFTPASLQRWQEVFDFFIEQRLGLSIHAAVPSLAGKPSSCALTPQQYEQFLPELLDYYIEHRREICVTSLDQFCKGVCSGKGQVCTFRDCSGEFLVIDPVGDIYPCQRFAGLRDFSLGNISHGPGLGDIFAGPAAQQMREREQRVQQVCADCRHLPYCKGGCAYNAWAGNKTDNVKDPFCSAYSRLFDTVIERLDREMASEQNIEAIVHEPVRDVGHVLLREGPLIELVREGAHPSMMVRSARRVVAAVELARGPDIPAAASRLVKMGIARSQQSGEASLRNLKRSIQAAASGLNRLYLHITFRCQLACSHCYACADASGLQQPDMPVNAIIDLIRQAKELGFNQVTITGGEPLMHRRRDQLLEALQEARQWAAPMNIVLRTNLAVPLTDEEIVKIGAGADQVVVSVDGDETGHDARRGKGSYASTVKNLEMYCKIAASHNNNKEMAELSLAAVLHLAEARSGLGEAVRQLGQRLGIKRLRFKPLLPIGRALHRDHPLPPESPKAFASPGEIIANNFQPVNTCGLGQNLYVESSGESFPCYAYHRPHAFLGNVIRLGLGPVVSSENFKDLARHTLDSNPRCSQCDVRYLCGGACRAWGGEITQYHLDTPPPDCDNLKKRAQELLACAILKASKDGSFHQYRLNKKFLQGGAGGAVFSKSAPPAHRR